MGEESISSMIVILEIPYDGQFNRGLPDQKALQTLDEIENTVLEQLRDLDGYLNIGRQTADNLREVYFACKDFRKPSKVLSRLIEEHSSQKLTYHIYKDKYWRSFDRFRA